MIFGSEPISIKGQSLDKLEKQVMFEVIELLKTYGFSVCDCQRVLEAISSEIASVAAHEKI